MNIKKCTTKITIDTDWLYHWIIDDEMLMSVYENGILSRQKLEENKLDNFEDEIIGCNGIEYISVCKLLEADRNAYNIYIKPNKAFIIRGDIEKINSKPLNEKSKLQLLRKLLKLPIEEVYIVNFTDEYLIKDQILFSDIVGLKLPHHYTKEDILDLIEFLEKIDYYLPIIDIERKLEIDQKKAKKVLKR